ncbi:phosphatase PAP2 family protein [Ectobacillus funiculus]|uniref:Phosphatase PAP2 family protein n=1 Tax=Ectobacillus funiculus TaxID=137993 RepID=A0ABV5W9M6_9BACI
MIARSINALYEIECCIFKGINRYFERKVLNIYFRTITHAGGARCTILSVLLLILLSKGTIHKTAIVSMASLAISHIPVQIFKKLYPRKRPYMMIVGTKHHLNPLQDHSFPSGHTTAIFSVVIPFIVDVPASVFLLLPLALSVGVSRIYLGLHYPSDVLAGMFLGTLTGILTYFQIIQLL